MKDQSIELDRLTDLEKYLILTSAWDWDSARKQGFERTRREEELIAWAASQFRVEVVADAHERFASSWHWIEANWTDLEAIGLISATPDGDRYFYNALLYGTFVTPPSEIKSLSFASVVSRIQTIIDGNGSTIPNAHKSSSESGSDGVTKER